MRAALLPADFRLRRSGWIFICLVGAAFGDTSALADEVAIDFGRDIAPLLSENCFQCHGPDVQQRQAELRLDTRRGALAELEDGGSAIVAGDPNASRLVGRIKSTDDGSRMPPPDSNRQLSQRQIQLLETWIEQGARWTKHWAYRDLPPIQLPSVSRSSWIRAPIDAYILARLERAGLEPAPDASRRVLARRLYLDLVGLPPTPDQVAIFERDRSPDAYARLVDRLLASPHYGERWGRHWLDVARYGDSNGGDENHLYPHAHRYRNFVIDAWNRGLRYDRFLMQQLAGDLSSSDRADRASAATATGFLALGMKILAEQDPVKKRADIVDEQIDTFGKAVLGMTLGCARCHDHKFDPIPTHDYYALAGIFHSTDVIDAELQTDAYLDATKRYNERLVELERRRLVLEQDLANGASRGALINRQAESFDRGNVAVIKEGYGEGIGVISDPGAQQNFVEYDMTNVTAGDYVLQLRYAAAQSRPGRIELNGELVKDRAIAETTGGWHPEHQRWFGEGIVALQNGRNTLRIQSSPLMSHLDQIRLIGVDAAPHVIASLSKIEEREQELERLKADKPQAQMVMAVRDGDVRNTSVHIRGSHLSLGPKVPRRFLTILSPAKTELTTDQSGRLELAQWLTEPGTPAAALTSRVIVNRIWLWHFGQGLVATPNDFGLQGARPTHPELLEWLSTCLMRHQWSIKDLQREILMSSTYRMSGRPHTARRADDIGRKLYAYRPAKRMEAELFRDALLWHAGVLDQQLGGAPPNVKSGDPSPEDLARNRETYDQSRRRSVYLPIVRTNVYELLTLLDFPDSASPIGQRAQTVVPTQSLLLLNSSFVLAQSQQITSRVLSRGADPRRRIEQLYLLLFARKPTEQEMQGAAEFLESFVRTSATIEESWTALCQTLLISHEFFYVE